jgi:hypothetical protein
VGSRVKTYSAGTGDGGSDPDGREWVFGLLASPRYRERVQQLEGLDLLRRPGCEPCLRALVVRDWTPATLHHLGWCESCRRAALALGMRAPAAEGATWFRRHAAWLAVAAFAAVAVPLVASEVVDRGSSGGQRGGVAISTTATSGTSTPGATTVVTTDPGTTTPATTTGSVTPVPRSKPVKAVRHTRGGVAKKALPLTT